jgi:hypothetical protein
MASASRLLPVLLLVLVGAPSIVASAPVPSTSSPGSVPTRSRVTTEDATVDASVWLDRMRGGMDASNLLIEDIMVSNDLYALGREGGNYIEALLMAYRATSDRRFLDRVLELTDLAKSQLRDAWLDGTTDGFTDWLWLTDPTNSQFYGKDTNWLDESITSGNVALWAWAFHANRDLDPRYAAAADFWRDWLENQFLAKWYQRAGDPLRAWNTPFAAFYKPDVEPRSANWRLAYYLWRITGNAFYRDRTDEIVEELIGAQQINPAYPTAYRWTRQTDPSSQSWMATNYANYYARVVIEMNLEGMPFYSSSTEMARFASTFRDVIYRNSLPGLSTMAGDVSGGGSAGFAPYAFNGFAAWDPTGTLMTIADRAITGVGNYATGGRSKAARNDTYISAYALLSLSLTGTTAVTVRSFTAVPLADGTVRIEWELSPEAGATITRLQRVREDRGERTRVGVDATGGPGIHVLVDTPPADTRSLAYELEEVTPGGGRRLGRVAVVREPTSGNGVAVEANQPNPFSTSTSIHFDVPRATRVRITAWDAAGRRVRVLHDGDFAPGHHAVEWNGRDEGGRVLPNGTYLYTLEADGVTLTRRAIRVR